MKTRQDPSPEQGRSARVERPVTKELGGDDDTSAPNVALDDFDDADTEGRPFRVVNTMKTAEVDVDRDRRATIVSPIPAILAEAMTSDGKPAGARDPATPAAEGEPQLTRRLGESDPYALGSGPQPLPADAGAAPRRQRAAAFIDQARAALDAGDYTAAVAAAEAALIEADEAPPPGIVEVIEPARPLFARVFSAFVGPLSGVPVLAPRAEEIARRRLGPRERVVMTRIDGTRTLDQMFDGSGVGSTDALRIVARLMRAGAVRVI